MTRIWCPNHEAPFTVGPLSPALLDGDRILCARCSHQCPRCRRYCICEPGRERLRWCTHCPGDRR